MFPQQFRRQVMSDVVRPEVAALVERGQVEIAEVEHFNPHCNVSEARVLILAWTNSSLARVIDRTLAGINLNLSPQPPTPPVGPGEPAPLGPVDVAQWGPLCQVMATVKRSINRAIGQPYAHVLAGEVGNALAGIADWQNVPSGYRYT